MNSAGNPAQTFTSPEVRVVEASAGSGKTFALARRYVQLLLNPKLHKEEIPLRSILAITFTNKASFEMKARILFFLKKTALQALSEVEEREILKPLGLAPGDAAPKAALIMQQLIHHYNFFQVQTIDSFVNAMLSGCAFKIGLSANFMIKTNSSEYLHYSLDKMIDLALKDKKLKRIFDEFVHQYLFLENKTGWFPKQDILELLSALYQQSNMYGLNFMPGAVGADKLFKIKSEALGLMRDLFDNIPEGTNAGFVRSLDKFVTNNKQGFDIDTLSAYFNREVYPANKGVKVPATVKRLWERIRKKLKDLSEAEATSLFNPYIAMFDEAALLFKDAAQKDDVLFLEQLNKETRALFDKDAVTVEELYYRLATRFRHYLVDEFQDTSRLQWKNLHLMVEEALSTGGTLFYVGDKKQAIYSFRGGDVGLFDEIKARFGHFNVYTEQLARNFRSCEALVNFNNHVFSLDNLTRFIGLKEGHEADKKKKEAVVFADEDYAKLARVFDTSQQVPRDDKKGGYVRVERIEEKKKETRDEIIKEKLLKLVGGLKGRCSLSDIAILCRDNKEVEECTAWLLEEGIFVESERTLNIKENPLIGELMAFLRFLHSPIDNVAFAEFILGDIFTCASGLSKDAAHHFVFSLRSRLRGEGDFYLYREFRRAYPDAWDQLIDEFFRNIGLYPLYELMMSMVERLGVMKNFPNQQGFVMRFVELIKKCEDEDSDVASFLEHFEGLENEELYVNVSDTDAIRIQTVHKSKGLEFPVVILPFLGMEMHVGTGGGLGQRSFILDFSEDHLRLMRIKNKYLPFSQELRAVHHREYVQSFLNEINSIYVALTRAEQEMYIFIPERVGTGENFVNFLIPEEFTEVGAPAQGAPKEDKEKKKQKRIPVTDYCDWIDYLKDEFVDAGSVISRERALRGEVLHYLLAQEKMDFEQAGRQFPQFAEWDEVEQEVKAVMSAPGLTQFFEVNDGQVECEKDVVNRFGQTRRIDRLIVKDKEVWVIDYKSTREGEEGHKAQVSEYMDIIKDIYPGKAVRGFLIYLDEKKCEVV